MMRGGVGWIQQWDWMRMTKELEADVCLGCCSWTAKARCTTETVLSCYGKNNPSTRCREGIIPENIWELELTAVNMAKKHTRMQRAMTGTKHATTTKIHRPTRHWGELRT